jgi:hypothetical protein
MRGMTILALALTLSACDDGKAQEAATGAAAGGTGADEASASEAPAAGKPGAPPEKHNIERIPIAVPYGKQVACADVVDTALFAKYIGDKIGEVKDRSKSNSESNMACSLIRAGKPPTTDAQLHKFEREGMKLGVLPGDEYCQVTAYCSMSTDEERFRKKCEAEHDSGNEAVGQFACVHTTQRGTKQAYTYRAIDPDTRCLLEVMGGPSVTDEPLVQNCTRAALEDITSADMATWRR